MFQVVGQELLSVNYCKVRMLAKIKVYFFLNDSKVFIGFFCLRYLVNCTLLSTYQDIIENKYEMFCHWV